MQQEQILRSFQEKILSREDYFSSCVWNRRESFVEKASAAGQGSVGPESGCVMMCCHKCNGLPKKTHHLPYLVTKPVRGRSACIWEEKYFPFVSWCLRMSTSISVEERHGFCLGGCCVQLKVRAVNPQQLAALLDGCSKVKRAKPGKACFLPTNIWWTQIQCMWKPCPIHPKKTLIAFIHTPLLCEKSYMQHIGELWLWLQANFRSQTFLFSKLHLRSEKGSCPLVLKKNMFLFDAKIKAFSKALWCARQKDMQADSEGGLVFSNYQHSFWILLPRQNFNVK